ncbi:MAG: hypothetical protein AAF429_06480 [Pseudomonadota bacterium]
MSETRADEQKKLFSLADAIFEDIVNASEDETLEDVRAAGIDPVSVNDHMHSLFEKAKVNAGKRRMQIARDSRLSIQSTDQSSTANIVDISEARKTIEAVLNDKDISMAARNETMKELTDEEVLQKYTDLVRLGAISLDEN